VILAVNGDRAVGPRTGVGRNIEYLVKAWAGQPLPFDEVRIASPAPIPDLPQDPRFSPDVAAARGPGLVWQMRHLRRVASSADVLFSFYSTPPNHRGRSVVANLGIYEGEHSIDGWRARLYSRHFAHSARTADAVIANANATKRDLEHFYGVKPDRIVVVWPGADERFRPALNGEHAEVAATVEELLGERAPYFLFVGKLSRRRCVPELLEAFRGVVAHRPDFRFLLVGPDSPEGPLEDHVNRLGLGESVRHIQHLDQDRLAVLYRGARAFLMPAVREGFSHPVLEAMGSGCPVLALRDAVVGVLEFIDENVEGGAAGSVLLADDPSPASLQRALERLADDDDLCAELSDAGIRSAAAFPTWEEHAHSVMDVLERVASAPHKRGSPTDVR
jgi:glycosyltransferase involved in cell wall biosynthesis